MKTRKIPSTLPGVGRVDTLAKGAREALGNMRKQYGAAEGNRIFLAKADEQGKGKTIRAKVNFTYRKGTKLKGKK